jgi:prephenate dehydratase
MTKISFQGERGAYSEMAALNYFTKTQNNDESSIEFLPSLTFDDALNSTINGESDYTILPVENSIQGSVSESYDALYDTKLTAVGEAYQKIEHCLLGISTSDKIKTVYSHPQALGQCSDFIQKKSFKTIPTYDTAGSAGIIKEINQDDVACIASKNAAKIYNLNIIEERISNNLSNYTRFLVLSNKSTNETGKDKTSIIFSIKHQSGALYEIIKKFYEKNVNLTKIESRPKKETSWEYNFYVDFEGHQNNSKISELLDELKVETLFMKILGSYPVGIL